MILGTGELVVDCFREKEGLVARAGGAPFNALAGVALLGGETSFYGSVGDDSLGAFMEGEARRLPFKDLLIERKPGRMTTWTEVEERHGDRSFFFHRENGADYLLSFESFKPLLLKKPSIVHLGSLMLPFEEGQAFIRETVNYKKGHPALRLSFDVNYRDGLFPNKRAAYKAFGEIILRADIVKFSDDEFGDYLWFSDEDIFECLGISETEDEEEVDVSNYDCFDDFCCGRDCNSCPSYFIKGDCEEIFNDMKNV